MLDTKDRIKMKTEWRIDKFKDPNEKIARALRGWVIRYRLPFMRKSAITLRRGMSIKEAIARFSDRFIATEKIDGNIALNEGLQAIINLLAGIGVAPTLWNNANAHVGVGDSNAAENPTQVGLQAAVNKLWIAMDGGYPARTNQMCDWRGTFGAAQANFSWQEYTVVNAADDSGQNINRKIADKGTKAAGETWTLSVQITFS